MGVRRRGGGRAVKSVREETGSNRDEIGHAESNAVKFWPLSSWWLDGAFN